MSEGTKLLEFLKKENIPPRLAIEILQFYEKTMREKKEKAVVRYEKRRNR